ncbi:alpha-lactalbumin-like [Solea solea]|uniref:alpha-lactalbumin-like n=1 Tax=Solea solea TaxID=90069 RepID=UPI00272B2DBD|nr:alpha-lactalbumin-like [Solea solea]
MKSVVVLVLSVLTCGLADCKNVTICDVNDVINDRSLIPSHFSDQNLRAKVICKANPEVGMQTDWKEAGPQGGETLYGLFRLSNRLFCRDDSSDSTSIDHCDIHCNKFIDDDITDDVECVLGVFTNLLEHGFGFMSYNVTRLQELNQMVNNLLAGVCNGKKDQDYPLDQCQ